MTCQTVLIHVPDVRVALRDECACCVRAGGSSRRSPTTAPVRPSSEARGTRGRCMNASSCSVFNQSARRERSRSARATTARASRSPGLCAALGLVNLSVSLSDRAQALVPPYATRAQQAVRDEALAHAADPDHCMWGRTDTERYYRAGGGDSAEFEKHWNRGRNALSVDAAALRAGTYHCAGGAIQYVIAARRP